MLKGTLAAAIMVGPATALWAAPMPCDSLAKLNLAHVEITSASRVEQGAFTPPSPAGGGAAQRQNPVFKSLPAFCRVIATSHPTSDSDIKMEFWLPTEGWNGRLEVVGNNGMSGDIVYGNLAQGLAKGYATAGTNTGHEGEDGSFAIGHPEQLVDWGNRAIHETTVTAKAVVAAGYGSGPKYSYYNGCSTGGRQGWVEAEYYPNDFDGLAVGAPANPMQRLQAGQLWGYLALHKEPGSNIPDAKWVMIHEAVMNQCDAKDGLKDGLIEDPMACHFDTTTLLCKGGDAADCLTAPQLEALNKIVAGAKNPRTGQQVYPGWPLGANLGNGPFTHANPGNDSIYTFRDLFQDPNWDYHTLDYDKDIARADKLANQIMSAMDESRLKGLFGHGGKLLLYHGWNDTGISPLINIQYYENTVKQNGGLGKTYDSVRLFMVPGMGHCQGGDGPNAFDKMDVISDWVEKGKAPDQIIASHSTSGQVDRTRPLCPYPQIAKYKGSGSIDEAQNFACAKP